MVKKLMIYENDDIANRSLDIKFSKPERRKISDTTDETQLYNKISDLLSDTNAYVDYVDVFDDGTADVRIVLNWGDWKHDHLRMKLHMENTFDIVNMNSRVTEEDGSDTYSAEYTYVINL